MVLVGVVSTASCSLLLDPLPELVDGGDGDAGADSDTDDDVARDADDDLQTDGDPQAFCGDGTCNDGENVDSCPSDCTVTCGDGICSDGEDACSCGDDCSSCGVGDWSCVDDQCACSGRVCDGVCFRGAECCVADDCDVERGETCSDDHQCLCQIPEIPACIPARQDSYVDRWDDYDHSLYDVLISSYYVSVCRIALIEFDLPLLPHCAAESLEQAEMVLFFRDWGGYEGDVEAHMIEEGWDEVSVRWGGPDYSSEVSDTVRPTWSPGESYLWDVTSMAAQWIRDPSTNRGVALVVTTAETSFWFSSSNEFSSDVHPCLTLAFIDTDG